MLSPVTPSAERSLSTYRQTTSDQIQDADLEFQEQLIQEREGEIEQIEQGITELNQIFKDLGQIVGEQQSMIGTLSFSSFLSRSALIIGCDRRQYRDERSIGCERYSWGFDATHGGACVSEKSGEKNVLSLVGLLTRSNRCTTRCTSLLLSFPILSCVRLEADLCIARLNRYSLEFLFFVIPRSACCAF